MSKADELLKHLYFQFTDTSFAGKNYKEFKRRTLSNELVEDIENYLNRKDKIEKLELKHELDLEKNKSIWKKIFNKGRD